MTDLFDPIKIRSVVFPNRVGVSPMVQTSSFDGFAEDWHLVHLGSRAIGGAGLVITEATAIEKTGRISPNDLGIWKDSHIPNLFKIASFIKQQNAVAGIQIAHAGRKGSYSSPLNQYGLAHLKPLNISKGGWQTIAPSEISFELNGPTPKKMSKSNIKNIISSFQKAAIRADKANFDLLEVHAAHGYLLHQFYSPISNTRKDAYGKNIMGRIRMCLEVAEAIRLVWPKEKVLSFRISYTDWDKQGWNLNDSIILCNELKKRGVDLIDVSSGGTSPNSVAIAKELIEDRDKKNQESLIPLEPGYQVEAASSIRRKSKIKTAAVGLISSPHHAQKIISSKKSDFVYIGRDFLRDPYWPLRASMILKQTKKISIPGQYYLAWRNQENFKFDGYPFKKS